MAGASPPTFAFRNLVDRALRRSMTMWLANIARGAADPPDSICCFRFLFPFPTSDFETRSLPAFARCYPSQLNLLCRAPLLYFFKIFPPPLPAPSPGFNRLFASVHLPSLHSTFYFPKLLCFRAASENGDPSSRDPTRDQAGNCLLCRPREDCGRPPAVSKLNRAPSPRYKLAPG